MFGIFLQSFAEINPVLYTRWYQMWDKKSMVKAHKKDEKMPELLTLKEACAILKCHPNTLRQWDKKDMLKAIRIGAKKVMRYRKEDILKLVNQQKWHNNITKMPNPCGVKPEVWQKNPTRIETAI